MRAGGSRRQIYQAFRGADSARGAAHGPEAAQQARAGGAAVREPVHGGDGGAQLTSEGYVRAVPKKRAVRQRAGRTGARIAARAHTGARRPRQQVQIDFPPAAVDAQAFPYNTWRRLLRQCFDECDQTLLTASRRTRATRRCSPAVCQYLQQARGVRCSVEQVVGAGRPPAVGTGGLLPQNGRVAVENPV